MVTIQRLTGAGAPAATIPIRILVGSVFFSGGIQKSLWQDALGVGRFAKIGIPESATVALLSVWSRSCSARSSYSVS